MRYKSTVGSGIVCGAIAHNADAATVLRDLVCYCECELEGLIKWPGDIRFTSMNPKTKAVTQEPQAHEGVQGCVCKGV